jgi:hypothetical protein
MPEQNPEGQIRDSRDSREMKGNPNRKHICRKGIGILKRFVISIPHHQIENGT